MAFDGIVTKAITTEITPLCGARIDKVFEPNKNEIIFDNKMREIIKNFIIRGKAYVNNC